MPEAFCSRASWYDFPIASAWSFTNWLNLSVSIPPGHIVFTDIPFEQTVSESAFENASDEKKQELENSARAGSNDDGDGGNKKGGRPQLRKQTSQEKFVEKKRQNKKNMKEKQEILL